MIPVPKWLHWLGAWLFLFSIPSRAAVEGNRLTYLDGDDPFYVGVKFSKLVTPQWVGEPGVEAVVTLANTDHGAHAPFAYALAATATRTRAISLAGPLPRELCPITANRCSPAASPVTLYVSSVTSSASVTNSAAPGALC